MIRATDRGRYRSVERASGPGGVSRGQCPSGGDVRGVASVGRAVDFANSGGKTAEAAAHHNAGIRRDLDAHGNEALAVARAADRAADGIVKVQSELAALRHAAAAAELTIDALINRVVPIPGLRSTEAQWARTLAKQTELQAELDAIMAEANAVDEELASAVNMADGDAPIPADSGPPVGPEG